ncbi:MAG: YihY family inner membrane protein [Frankia sp.]|nr:YihY family inner membrane protein [Frankia sp.]
MPRPGLKDRAHAVVASRRRAWPWFDHLIRAGGRYKEDLGDRMAAGVSYYGFLSFFPLLLLAISIIGFVLHKDPDRQAALLRRLNEYLPGVGRTLSDTLTSVKNNRVSTGAVGLLGLALSGLGWVDSLRESLRVMWHQDVTVGNIVKKRVLDLIVLAGLGLTIAVSIGVSAVATGATSWALTQVGLKETFVAKLALKLLAIALVIAADALLFLYLFVRLPRCPWPWRRVVRGALFAAVGFTLLKFVGAYYIGRTVSRFAAYGATFAALIGLLVWINLASRFTLFAAAWTVTSFGDDDVKPSGTA